MAESSIEKARRQFEEAKARLQAVEARERTAERKRDTRRKVILGGALLELASRDAEAEKMIARLVSGLSRDRDRKSFEGWQPPSPAQSSSKAPQNAAEGS